MRTQQKQSEGERLRPLWGFGWVGWMGLAVLVALSIGMWRSSDPRWWLARIVYAPGRTFGDWAFVVLFTQFMHFFPVWTALPTMLLAIVATHIGPYRQYAWRVLVIVVTTLAAPVLYTWFAFDLLGHMSRTKSTWLGFDISQVADLMMHSERIVFGVVSAVVLGWAFRSIRFLLTIGAVSAMLFLVGRFSDALQRGFYFAPFVFSWEAIIWQIAAVSGMFIVAIRKRRRLRVGGFCSACGYDLRGLPSTSPQCPECGHSLASADSQ